MNYNWLVVYRRGQVLCYPMPQRARSPNDERRRQRRLQRVQRRYLKIACWVVEGETFCVGGQIYNFAEACQVRFSPERITAETKDDVIRSVELWYRNPVVGARLYAPDYGDPNAELKPVYRAVDLQDIPKRHLIWLVRFTEAEGQAVRWLLRTHVLKCRKALLS